MAQLAAYPCDEASDAVVDVTGNGHDITLVGNSVRTATGGGYTHGGATPNSKGLTQSSIGIDAGPAIFGKTTSRTLSFWMKMAADFTGWVFEHHVSGPDTGEWGGLCLSGSFGFRIRNAAGTVTQFASAARITDAAWHHYAGTFDAADQKVRLYTDGVLTTTSTALTGGVGTNADVFNIFNVTVGTSPTIDDPRVYDTALSAAQILATMGNAPPDGASLTLGLVSETSTAFQLARSKLLALQQIVETGTAFPLGSAKSAVLGLALESQAALSLSKSKSLSFGITQETDTAPALSGAKAGPLGMVAGSESALTTSATKSLAFGLPFDTGLPLPLTPVKVLTLGMVQEITTVFALNLAVGATLVLGLITEVDSALPFTFTKAKVLGVVSELGTAQPLGRSKALLLGQPTEADSALALALAKSLTLGLTQSTDVALALDIVGSDIVLKVMRNGVPVAVTLADMKVYRFGHLSDLISIAVSGHAEG